MCGTRIATRSDSQICRKNQTLGVAQTFSTQQILLSLDLNRENTQPATVAPERSIPFILRDIAISRQGLARRRDEITKTRSESLTNW
jgi:hypothetical protein